jgi:HlyD family secretion protein
MQYQRLAVAVLIAAVGVTGCGGGKKGAGSQGPRTPALNVDVAPASRRDIATYVSLDGQIAPLEQSTLSFQQSGPILAIYVNEGDRVSAGELLAKIDDSTLRAQLAQDEALVAQSAARARSSTLGVPITKAQTSEAVQSAKAALANAQLAYNQNQQLYRQGYVSQSQFEQARAAYVAAQTQYASAIANEQSTQVQSASAQADVAGVQSAAAQAQTLRTQIGQTSLYAPFDGIVTARLADPGAMASPSTQVLSVSRVDTVWININVPDEDLVYVHPGMTVTFNATQIGDRTFTGRIDTVNAVPTQGTLSYRARIRQPNPGALLRGGMLVSVTIQKEKHPGAIVVPRSAVAQTDTGSNVFVVAGGKAEEVPVRVGLQTDTLSEVISPKVRPGTLVVTTRPDALQNGSAVAVNGGRTAQ